MSTLVSTVTIESVPFLARPLRTQRTWMGLAIILLNMVDALGTLWNLSRGAEELNPLMSMLLAAGPNQFVLVKHLLASAGVLGILAHPGNRASRLALWILFPLYAGIALYQVALLLFLP